MSSIINNGNMKELYNEIAKEIDMSKENIVSAVNSEMVVLSE